MIEKFESLSNWELLSILVAEKKNESIGYEIMTKFESLKDAVIYSTEQQLSDINGLGKQRIAQIKALKEISKRLYNPQSIQRYKISAPLDVYTYVKADLMYEQVEHFMILLLNTKNQVTNKEHISTGTLNASIVHPREIFNPAIKKNANSIILIHNHPSGDPVPSNEDIEITNRLIDAGNLLGIRVLDHIVIGFDRYISFKEENLI